MAAIEFVGVELVLPFTLSVQEPTEVQRVISGKRFSVHPEAQWLTVRATTIPFPHASVHYNALWNHFISHGLHTSFSFPIPVVQFAPIMPHNYRAAVTQNASRGISQVRVPTQGGRNIPAGSLFKFSSHTKLYTTKTPLLSGTILQFTPSLIEDIPANTTSVQFGNNETIDMVGYYAQSQPFTLVRGING